MTQIPETPESGDMPADKDQTADQANVSAAMDYIAQLGWADVDHTVPAAQETDVATLPVIKKKIKKIRAPRHNFKDGCGVVLAHKHSNGGGWVADTARVDETCVVESRAQVYHTAQIRGYVVVANYAQVCGRAKVNGNSEITNRSYVAGDAHLTDVKVRDWAIVTGGRLIDCAVKEHASVYESPTIYGAAVDGDARVYGSVDVYRGHITGHARAHGAARLNRAILNGYVEVSQEARVFETTLKNTDYSQFKVVRGYERQPDGSVYEPHTTGDGRMTALLLVHGEAMLVGNDSDGTITGPFDVGGTAMIVNSAVRTRTGYNPQPSETVDVNESALIVGITANDALTFGAHNISADDRAAIARAPRAPAGAGFNFEVLSQPRRIMPVSQEVE